MGGYIYISIYFSYLYIHLFTMVYIYIYIHIIIDYTTVIVYSCIPFFRPRDQSLELCQWFHDRLGAARSNELSGIYFAYAVCLSNCYWADHVRQRWLDKQRHLVCWPCLLLTMMVWVFFQVRNVYKNLFRRKSEGRAVNKMWFKF